MGKSEQRPDARWRLADDAGGAEKHFLTGTHRIVAPEETIARVTPLLGDFGITRVANVTGLDNIGIPVVMVMRPNSRSVAVSQGKGVTLAAARASGLMEAIETWHAERIDLPLRYGRVGDLMQTCGLIDPDKLAQVQGSEFHRQKRLLWIEGHDLIEDQPRWVPYEMVHTDYTQPMPAGHGCFACSSNGLASGNNFLEATVHAICEVIERDATGLFSLGGPVQQATRRIDLETIDDNECAGIIARIADAGLDIAVWETTSNIGVPAFYAMLTGGEHEHVGEGAGCHPAKAVALSRTLSEAVQTRMTYISGARDDMGRQEFQAQGMVGKQAWARRLTGAGAGQASYHDIASIAGDTLEQDMDVLLARLRQAQIEHVVAVDLTKPRYGIAVVRVVIPGLEAPHDDAGYVPGARARAVMRDAS